MARVVTWHAQEYHNMKQFQRSPENRRLAGQLKFQQFKQEIHNRLLKVT